MSANQDKPAKKQGLAARRAAIGLLHLVLEEQVLLSAALEQSGGPLGTLEADERARAQRQAQDVLRNLGRADTCLKPYVKKRPPPAIRDILRLGCVELFLDNAAEHGVVDSAVSLARQHNARFGGMVNAVLRNVIRGGRDPWDASAPQRLPGWLRGRLLSAYGAKTVAAIEAAHEQPVPLDLTLNSNAPEDLLSKLNGNALSNGSIRLHQPGRVSGLPGYDEGFWWVQDAGATLPALILDAQRSERVGDFCAAPGGKTLQLAATGADVTAIDSSEHRVKRIRENLERTGLNARVEVADILTFSDDPYDAVLLDAPCSATGTIRRHPDLPFVKDTKDIKSLVALQQSMLDKAVTLLRPGGRLVFCTCSLLPQEGEDHVPGFLQRNPEMVLDAKALAKPFIDPDWLGPTGIRVRPDLWGDRGGIDGFFITAFVKKN